MFSVSARGKYNTFPFLSFLSKIPLVFSCTSSLGSEDSVYSLADLKISV